MKRIPTLNEKIEALGFQKKLKAYEAARKEIDELRQKLQDKVINKLYDEFSIDPLLWFFSPDEPYFRMTDHDERGMSNQDYIKLQMDHTHEDRPLKNIKMGTHIPTSCRDIKTLADTLQHQAYLVEALTDPGVQNLISSAHCAIRNKIDESKPNQDYREAKRDLDYMTNASGWCGIMVHSGTDTPEKLQELLDTMDPSQLRDFSGMMKLTSLTMNLKKPEELKKVIQYYFCVPDDHYNS